ncbi:MAG: phosphatidylglycerophosphatase A [Aquificae bacterium]|nr:phosphatidylglycerophosphatase A [Aquificota bacterium]
MSLKDYLAFLVATGGFVGKIPIAPGTLGTLVAIPIILIYWNKGVIAQLSITAAVFFVGLWASIVLVEKYNEKDPEYIVVDEIAGFMITMIAIEPTFVHLALGFVLFRLYDILKPPPIKMFERLPSGLGVMADDIIAGIYAWLCLLLIIKIFNI